VYKGVGIVCASDFIISSYIPSLSALMKARRGFEPIPRQELKSFLLAESEASGYAPLHEAKKEIMEISKMMTATGSTPRIDTTPLVQSVLEGLPTVNVLHLACHGIQKPDALESHFVLHDGSLSIATLTKLELKNPILAFLSACETAKGDRNQPDQAVHLAASMLFCGFRSVIGTMWYVRAKTSIHVLIYYPGQWMIKTGPLSQRQCMVSSCRRKLWSSTIFLLRLISLFESYALVVSHQAAGLRLFI
jgi:hypothetical protein